MHLSKDHDCYYILIDSRESILPLTVLDIYKLPESFANLAASVGVDISRIRRAVVVDQSQIDHSVSDTDIAEYVQTAQIFDDIQLGRLWLIETRLAETKAR